MKVAVIDLGTNTFHLMLTEVTSTSHRIFYKDRKPVKIGEKGINKDEITEEAWNRAISALKEFNQIIEDHQIDKVYGTATSAIRNAKNGLELVTAIKEKTGIEIEVISGIREAELIHLGASKALNLGLEKHLIMDIGGGSIEFIIADKNQAYWMHSFEIGGQRLVENFHKSDPITSEQIKNLNTFFESELQLLFEACTTWQPKTLVGCSGTFDTLSDIHTAMKGIKTDPNATELPFSVSAFDEIHEELIQKTREQRLQIPGMIPMRVEMIVVASVLVHFLIQKLQLTNIRVSAYALKEGILHNVLEKLQIDEAGI